jgi:hypothetical protein
MFVPVSNGLFFLHAKIGGHLSSRFDADQKIGDAPAGAAEKTCPAGGMVSALSCAEGPLGLGFWPFFGANCASRFFCSLSG